jgi:glycosyltransferase involved in cell wall biosynthesis
VTAPRGDAVDERVLAELAREHPGLRLPPVVVVIAAYNEAAGVPRVLASLPEEACGLPVGVLVVDDGSSDGTAEAARAAGRGLVVACPTNRGQGRALRLGYRVAREHGAEYVVTTDADGQYSPDDIPAVLAPVVEGRADFVTGSRRLGSLENRDAVRQAGTYVFAWLASLLLGRRITDTSFGLRAMRAEVTAAVTLEQPQYQASELLVGVFAHGFRYAEVPATMRVRSAGSSKKGGNLAYGARYARVMLGTWWREGRPRARSG